MCKWLVITFCLVVNSCANAISTTASAQNNFEAKKIAIVDNSFVLDNSMAMQSIKKLTNQIYQKIRQDEEQKVAELKTIEEELLLLKKRSTFSKEAFMHEVQTFETRVSGLQRETQEKKARLQKAHAGAVGKVHGVILDIISDLARKYNLNLVMANTQVLFATNNLNITLEVTEKLNNKLKYVEMDYK